MFERGDVVKYDDDSGYLIFDGEKCLDFPVSDEGLNETCFGRDELLPYTGPIYEKDGQRFVPSGEFRPAQVGEWYFDEEVVYAACGPTTYRPILLPVPELKPEHEFKVGDWVKDNNYRVFCVAGYSPQGHIQWSSGGPHMAREPFTKLPGRPLTTDDLMRVLSGDKVIVECYACGCDGVEGELRLEAFSNGVYFFHRPSNENVAKVADGSIVFADGVEGNIFVIEEDN